MTDEQTKADLAKFEARYKQALRNEIAYKRGEAVEASPEPGRSWTDIRSNMYADLSAYYRNVHGWNACPASGYAYNNLTDWDHDVEKELRYGPYKYASLFEKEGGDELYDDTDTR